MASRLQPATTERLQEMRRTGVEQPGRNGHTRERVEADRTVRERVSDWRVCRGKGKDRPGRPASLLLQQPASLPACCCSSLPLGAQRLFLLSHSPRAFLASNHPCTLPVNQLSPIAPSPGTGMLAQLSIPALLGSARLALDRSPPHSPLPQIRPPLKDGRRLAHAWAPSSSTGQSSCSRPSHREPCGRMGINGFLQGIRTTLLLAADSSGP